MAAFRHAVKIGANFIETDLHLTRDAWLVAIHDDTLERTTNGSGPVAAKTLEDLRTLDAGSWFRERSGAGAPSEFAGERLPTIEEIFKLGREHDLGLYLEIKAPGASGAEHAVVGAARAAGEIGRTVVISFDPGVLARVRKYEPLLMTGLLFSDPVPPAKIVADAIRVGARQLLPKVDLVTPELIAEARSNDFLVVAWTVNEPDKMRSLMTLGVAGIITDYPEKALALTRST